MNFLKNIFNLFINSSVHVALAVVALSLLSFLEYGLPPDWDLLFFIFFGGITGYNFVKYAGVAKLHHASLARNLKFIQIFSLFSFVALVLISFRLNKMVLFYCGIFAMLTLLYAAPVFKGNNLRNIAGIKIFIIAVVWAGVSVVLPLLDFPEIELREILILFLQRLLFVVVITLPFELRDLQFDSPGLRTIPQQFGIKRTRIFGIALLIFIAALEFFKTRLVLGNFIPLFLTLIISGIFLLKAGGEQRRYFSSFWVEGIPFMWLGLWMIFRNLV